MTIYDPSDQGKARKHKPEVPGQAGLFDREPTTFPAQRHSETSRAAADQARPGAGRQRMRVFNAILSAGRDGLTDIECQAVTEINPSAQRPRRIELVNQGAVIKTNRKRKTPSGRNAAVYVAEEFAA